MTHNKLTCFIVACTEAFEQHNVSNNTHQYLTPDYFLPSSSNSSYYRRKYGGGINQNNHKLQSKFRRIVRVASVIMLSLGLLATAVEVDASPIFKSTTETSTPLQPAKKKSLLKRAGHKVAKRLGFSSSKQDTNTDELVSKDLESSTTNIPKAPVMPNFVSDTSSVGASDNRSALLDSIRGFDQSQLRKPKPKPKVVSSDDGDVMSQLRSTLERRRNGIAGEERDAKPKKVVKQAPKLTADEQAQKKAENLARAATIREQNKKKWEEAVKKNEEIARERRRAEAEAVKARIEQKRKERGEDIESVVNGIDPALHHNIVSDLRSEIAVLREQLKNQVSSNLAGTLGGGTEEPIYSKPIDTISMTSSSTQYEEPWEEHATPIGEAFSSEFTSNKQNEPSVPELSTSSSTEDLSTMQPNSLSREEEKAIEMLDRAMEDSGYSGSSCGGVDSRSESGSSSLDNWSDAASIAGTDGYDTVHTDSDYESSIVDEEESTKPKAYTTEGSNTDQPIDKSTESIEVEDQALSFASSDETNFVSIAANSKESEEALQEVSWEGSEQQLSDSNIGSKDAEEESIKDPITEASVTEATVSTFSKPEVQAASMNKEELLKQVTEVAAMHNQVREACIVAGKQIRHRIFVRDALTSAVAAGDEEQGNIAGYHLWSSGTLGTAKQKAQTSSNGYSGRMFGGSIGADIHFENDLLLGASFSKIRSSIKHRSQGSYNDLQNQYKNTNHNTYIFSLYGSGLVSPNMSIGVIGSSGVSKARGSKARSKLFSFESHLNYKVLLPQEVTLIPHIGFRYEYEKTKSYKEQVTRENVIERGKRSYQAFNTEIGSRVIFAPIRLAGSLESGLSSSFIITPTAHVSIERRIGSIGKSQPFTLSYQEMGGEVSTSTLSVNLQYTKTSLNSGIGLIASRKNIKLELLYDQQMQKRFRSHQGVLKLKVGL